MMVRPPGQKVREQIAQELAVRNTIHTPQHAADAAVASSAAAAARALARGGGDDDVDLTGGNEERYEGRRKVSSQRGLQ